MEAYCSKSDGKSADASKKVVFEPMRIGPISTLEEMDIKVLKFQNKKLAMRLDDRKRIESELRQRIEQLEKRQTQDDAVLNVINRYWNQLNEDVRLMLLRFDAESAHDLEAQSESEAATSFLMQLSTWDKEELDEKLANRVQVSKRAVAKIIQVYDRLLLKYEKMLNFLESLPNFNTDHIDTDSQHVSVDFKNNEMIGKHSDGENNSYQFETENSDKEIAEKSNKDQTEDSEMKEEHNETNDKEKNAENSDEEKFKNPMAVAQQYKEMYSECLRENVRLHQIITSLQESQHSMSLKFKELQDTLNVRETEIAELQNRVDDVEYENSKLQTKNCRIEHYLAETLEKMRAQEQALAERGSTATDPVARTNVSHKKIEELAEELEEQRELATNTLQELEALNIKYRENLKKVEELQMDLKHLPESVVVETPEYKCLQSHFSVLYNDSMQMRTQLEEYQTQIQTLQSSYLRKMELMETEELVTQKRLRTELLQMDDVNSQLRKEYEMLRMEFEQNLVANEQTGPINREMRHLITSLQDHNLQLKSDVHRYKRKYKELSNELGRNKKTQDGHKVRNESEANINIDTKEKKCEFLAKEEPMDIKTESMETDFGTSSEISSAQGASEKDSKSNITVKEESINQEGNELSPQKRPPTASNLKNFPSQCDLSQSSRDNQNRLKDVKENKDGKDLKNADNEFIRDLKNQLKKAVNEQKELKLLLDMYKGVNKDKRDKAQLMLIEKKLRAELEELKQQMRRLQESKREGYKKLADEDALQRIKYLEEQNHALQKQVQMHKQEEEALLSEMEVTGQAFEDMQEQNSRLIQQLREKDEANFKLMTERIKSNQLYKVSREEKDVLQEKINMASKQLESVNSVVHKLEEKEKIYQTALSNLEKEMLIRQQALELHKRKAIENAQSAADLKLHLEKYHAQMKEAQQIVSEKTSALEAEAYKNNRLQEEIAQLKRKVERMKKIEAAGTPNIVLMEEIREYKETLTCPSCKVKRKDAVLTKCFHVFCWDCLKARYETRQRKCPKCNAAFGANDYHRLYLSN